MAPDAPIARWDARKVVNATLAGAGVAACFLFVYRFRLVFLGAFVGVVLAAALRPIMAALVFRGVRRDVGALLAFTLLSTVALGVIVLAAPLVVDQVAAALARLPGYYADLRTWLLDSPSRLLRHTVSRLPAHFDPMRSIARPHPEQIFATVEHIGFGLLYVLAIVLFAFYWTIDGDLGAQVLARLAPLDRRDEARAFLAEAEGRLGSYVRAQFLVCLTVGTLAFVAYLVIGVPNAIVFALFAAVLEVIPVIGPALGNLPAFLIMLAIHPASAVWVVLAAIVIQALENYVLFPRFMGKSAGVHPLTCLLAIVAFGSLLGILGVFLAIPLALLLQLAFERLVVRTDGEVAPPAGRDRADVLRYDARTLAAAAHRLAETPALSTSSELVGIAEEVEALASELDTLLPRTLGERRPAKEAA